LLSGEVLWQHAPLEDWLSHNIVADVAYADDQVFAASATSGSVLAYDAADGSLQWSTPSLAWRDTSLQVVDDALYVSTGEKVHTLNTRTGALVETVTLPGGLTGAQYTPDLAYTPLQVVDTHTLQQRFRLETPQDRDPGLFCDRYWLPFAFTSDAFYGATACGVYRLNHLGKVDWRYYGDAPPAALTAEYGGYVYVLLKNGAIVALESTTGREVGRMQTAPRLLDYTQGGLTTRGLVSSKCGIVAVFNSYDVWGFTDPAALPCE
jgi:outer membrane protein assembly factor BamB